MGRTNKGMVSFLAIAFGFTWGIAGIGALFGINAASGMPYMGMAALCMLGPALAAIVQHRLIEQRSWETLGLGLKDIRWKWIIWTCVVGLCIVPFTMVAVHFFGNVLGIPSFGKVSVTGARFAIAVQELSAAMGGAPEAKGLNAMLSKLPGGAILAVLLLSAVFTAFTFNLPFMLGEELGWRGYLYTATSHWPTLKRILFTGSVWGFWHAPLIAMGHNYPGYPIIGIGVMVVFCVLLAFLFDWCRTRTNSVWGPSILHGLINGTAGAMALFAWDGTVLFASPAGVAGFVAIAALVVAVVALDGAYRRALISSGPVNDVITLQ